MKPYWIVGFVDGDGSFNIQKLGMKGKRGCRLEFSITQKSINRQVLYDIQQFFGTGEVVRQSGPSVSEQSKSTLKEEYWQYRVRKLKCLCECIVPFFEKHPLCTRKNKDFVLWADIVKQVASGRLLNEKEIENLRSNMNHRRQPRLEPQTDAKILSFSSLLVPDLMPEWVVGFCDAEAGFHFHLSVSKNVSCGWSTCLEFYVTQLTSDEQILIALRKFFQCGSIRKDGLRNTSKLRICSKKDLLNYIVPFFIRFPLQLKERKEIFGIFSEVLEIVKKGHHLTKQGIARIKELKKITSIR